MKNTFRYLAFLLCWINLSATAQTYPVQAFVQVSPPYTSYLPEYADPFNNQMKILLTLMDFSVPSYNVKVRLTFEGSGYTIQTESLLPLPVINLTPGIPVQISGGDLAPYLATSNLIFSGLDVADYEKRKVLPEGPCTICAEVIDYGGANQNVLSNKSCAQVWFSLYDPPFLNTPFCGSEVKPLVPQQAFFSWTPMNMSSPGSFANTEYTFELFEIWPNGADPNQVVNSSLPIYIEQTTFTFINYGIMQPPLQVGMSYVWRVRATDITGKDAFKNNGYSQVCTFMYGSLAGSLAEGIKLQLNSNGTGVRQGFAWWNGSASLESYILEVRKTGNPPSGEYAWFPYSSDVAQLKVNSLEPSTEYECRVKGIVGDAETDWSNISVFTTQAEPEYACGSTALPGTTQNIIPLKTLLPGQHLTVGQFDLLVSSAKPLAAPGHYQGFGKISVPFAFINLKVKFDDILVDENMFVRQGKVEALTQGIDNWVDEILNEPFYVPGKITDFTFNGDSSVTVYFNDEELTFDFPEGGGPVVIEDEDGLIYTFYPDGSYDIDGGITISEDNLAASANYRVDFEAHEDQIFGFDKLEHLVWQKNHEAILLLDSTYYFTSYKSIAPGAADKVLAKFVGDNAPNSLVFKRNNGTVIPSEKKNGTTWELSLSNFSASDYVYAFDGELKIGKVWVKVYDPKELELIVVPVGSATAVFGSAQTAELNSVYAQANVSWKVTIADEFTDLSWDYNGDGKLESADATLMQKYSAEMRGLRDAYFAAHGSKDAQYIFVVKNFSNAEMQGYMVRGRAVGFVSEDAGAIEIAHELGHGAFGLVHTFPAVSQGESQNLMDYAGGVHLTQAQWYEIHDWVPEFAFGDDEEDFSLLQKQTEDILEFYYDAQTFTTVDDKYAFPLLDGTWMKIPDVASIVFTKYGKVFKFKIADKVYRPIFTYGDVTGAYRHEGYFTETDRNFILHDIPNMSQQKPAMKELRYKGFGSVAENDSVFTESVKFEYGQFTGCYCEMRWKSEVANDATTYLNAEATYNSSIHTSLDFPDEIKTAKCLGECPDYGSYDIDGPAENLFVALSKDLDESKWNDLAKVVQHINKTCTGKTFVFYAELSTDYSNGQNYWYSYDKTSISTQSSTIKFFRDFEIFTLEKFNDFFPVVSDGDETFNIIFSPVDLWEFKNTAPHYNVHSIDYTSFPIPHVKDWDPQDSGPVLEVMDFLKELFDYQTKLFPELLDDPNFEEMAAFIVAVKLDPIKWLGEKLQLRTNIVGCFNLLGMFDRFEYALSDLIARRTIMRSSSNALKNAVTTAEADGKAVALSYDSDYSQYVSRFDTESAFFLGFQYMKMFVESVFEPVALGNLLAQMSKVTKSYKAFKPIKNIDGVLGGGGALYYDELNTELRKIHGELVENGYKAFDDGSQIVFKSIEGIDVARIIDNALQVKIPHGTGWATQTYDLNSIKILNQVKLDRKLYRIGTLEITETTGAQYWSPENPLSFSNIEDYAQKYGVPVERLKGENKFVLIATIRDEAIIISRPSVPYGGSEGGGIEIITTKNGVSLDSFHTINIE